MLLNVESVLTKVYTFTPVKAIRILIVEDEPIIAADLEDRLQEMGYDVLQVCSSGEEALALVGKHPATPPDLVIMDVKLDGALDGIETAQMMLKSAAIPIIFLTSNTDDATFRRAQAILPAAFLTKPFRGKDLWRAIELAITRGIVPQATVTDANAGSAHLFQDRLFIKTKDRLTRIFLNDILWAEADDYYCKLITTEKEFLITQTLKQLEESLSNHPAFFRVHRSYLVNLDKVEEIGDVSLFIRKKAIPINKASKDELISRLPKI